MFNILVTGATGYIGSKLIRSLSKNPDFNLYALVRPDSNTKSLVELLGKEKLINYTGLDSLLNFFSAKQIDLVIHLAAYVGSGHNRNEVENNINGNLLLIAHLLEGMRLGGTNKIINTGSYWEFGDKEDQFPKTTYAIYKSTSRKLISHYSQAYNFKFINLILYDVYGPEDERDKLIPTLIKLDNQSELKMSPGHQQLFFTYIDDVVSGYQNAIKSILENTNVNKTFHLRSNSLKSLRDLVSIIEKERDYELNIAWGKRSYPEYQIMKPYEGGAQLPGWTPKTDLEKGLKTIISN